MRSVFLGLSLPLAMSACITIPEGRFTCEVDEDCPSGQLCRASDHLCHADPDVTMNDAASTAPEDAEAGAPQQPEDAGAPEAPDAGTDAQIAGCVETDAEDDAIFVSLAGTTALNCGSIDEPCQSIALGLSHALMARRTKVYVASGEYAETVALPAGITLRGGWVHIGKRFLWLCNTDRASRVVIASPTAKGVTASYVGASTLDTLTVRTGPTAPGESRYAVFVSGKETALTMNDVHAEASAGGDGASGAAGVVGAAGSGTCAAGTGAPGAAGAAGAHATAGTFGPDGYTAEAGKIGEAGGAGTAGAAGTPTCAPCLADGALCDANCAPTASTTQTCGQSGPTGCAGAGGAGGGGGQSGGSSIGLYVVDSKVTIQGGSQRAGSAGAGGVGGGGGTGGAGAMGVVGAEGTACRRCSSRFVIRPIDDKLAKSVAAQVLPKPFPFPTKLCSVVTTASPGVVGGAGGIGGAGGRGGDGAAGASFAVHTVGTGSVQNLPTP